MRLTDLPPLVRNYLPAPLKLNIQPISEIDQISEFAAIGAGLSAAAAVGWILSHPDLPIYSRAEEINIERKEKAAETLDRLLDKIPDLIESGSDANAAQMEAIGNLIPSVSKLLLG